MHIIVELFKGKYIIIIPGKQSNATLPGGACRFVVLLQYVGAEELGQHAQELVHVGYQPEPWYVDGYSVDATIYYKYHGMNICLLR